MRLCNTILETCIKKYGLSMTYCTVSARMNTEVKAQFFQVCEELGLSPSTAINMFAKAMIRKNGFSFVLQIEKPPQETMKAIEEAIEEKDLVGPFSTADDVMDSLNT